MLRVSSCQVRRWVETWGWFQVLKGSRGPNGCVLVTLFRVHSGRVRSIFRIPSGAACCSSSALIASLRMLLLVSDGRPRSFLVKTAWQLTSLILY